MTKINKKNLNQLASQPLIYQAKDGSIELKSFVKTQTDIAKKIVNKIIF